MVDSTSKEREGGTRAPLLPPLLHILPDRRKQPRSQNRELPDGNNPHLAAMEKKEISKNVQKM